MRERDHLEDPCIDGRIIYNGSSRSGKEGQGLDSSSLRWGQVTGAYECNNEHFGSVKFGVFFD
jgi:hypothetical protein